MKKIFSLTLLALTFGFSQTVFAAEDCCWIDVKTGKQVRTVPSAGVNTGMAATLDAGAAILSPDGKTAFNTRTKQNFAREPNGCWIDVKTGKQVRTVPSAGVNTGMAATLDAGAAILSPDGKTAFNSRTKQNFARVPCPPTETAQPPPPPPTEHGLKTEPDLFEFGFGYNYINAPDEEEVKNLHGFNASLFVNVNPWLAFGGEFAAGFGDETFRIVDDDVDVSLDRYLYLFGPRVSVRPTERFRIFAQAMLGGVHDNTEVTITGPGGFSANSSTSADSWAFDFGVGADWRLTNHWSWRIIQADYLATTFSSPNNDHWQDNWRLSTGIVFSFGGKESPRTNDYSKERPISAK